MNLGNLVPSSDTDNGGSFGVVGPQFSIEEELRCANHVEEGYDLFDTRYEEWLKCNHPEGPGKTTMMSSTLLCVGVRKSTSW